MLKILNWQTLEHRRSQISLIMLYKIKNNLAAVSHHHLAETRNHFFVPYTRSQYHMNSYFPRTIRYWNGRMVSLTVSMPAPVTGLATVTFKKQSHFIFSSTGRRSIYVKYPFTCIVCACPYSSNIF